MTDTSDIFDTPGWQPREDAIAELMEKEGMTREEAERATADHWSLRSPEEG